jgi:hypothetical protein
VVLLGLSVPPAQAAQTGQFVLRRSISNGSTGHPTRS